MHSLCCLVYQWNLQLTKEVFDFPSILFFVFLGIFLPVAVKIILLVEIINSSYTVRGKIFVCFYRKRLFAKIYVLNLLLLLYTSLCAHVSNAFQ